MSASHPYPPTPSFHEVVAVKSGALTKQGSLFKAWKKRLFQLQDDFLLYYITPDDARPHGALYLGGCSVHEEVETSRLESARLHAPVFVFSITCSRSWNLESKKTFERRCYTFACDSFSDMNDWLAICRHRSSAQTQTGDQSKNAESSSVEADFARSYIAFATPSAEVKRSVLTASSEPAPVA